MTGVATAVEAPTALPGPLRLDWRRLATPTIDPAPFTPGPARRPARPGSPVARTRDSARHAVAAGGGAAPAWGDQGRSLAAIRGRLGARASGGVHLGGHHTSRPAVHPRVRPIHPRIRADGMAFPRPHPRPLRRRAGRRPQCPGPPGRRAVLRARRRAVAAGPLGAPRRPAQRGLRRRRRPDASGDPDSRGVRAARAPRPSALGKPRRAGVPRAHVHRPDGRRRDGAEGTFDGFTIPLACRAGWWHCPDRCANEEFIRFTLDRAVYR